jgi:restriction endonuclease S subunit
LPVFLLIAAVLAFFVENILKNKLKKEIRDVAQTQTGLFAKPGAQGEIVYLQGKHFDESGNLTHSLHPDLPADQVSDKHLLKAGDVLFAAKGNKNFAAVYESHNPAAVASTSFFVLRRTTETMLPEYFAWFLNNPSTQTLLKAQAIGTSMASISKAVLEELEIPIPSLETQKAIVHITRLRNTEKKLKQQIEALREKQIQQQILKAINN